MPRSPRQRPIFLASAAVLLVFTAAFLLAICERPLRGADRITLGDDAWTRWGHRSGSVMFDPQESEPVDPDVAMRVLFVGNSFVHYNDGVEKVLADLLEERLGRRLHAARYAPGGYTWAQHLADSRDPQHVLFRLLGAGGSAHWDYVIFQEQSQQPGLGGKEYAASLQALEGLVAQAKARGAVSVLMMTWAYMEGDPSHPDLFGTYHDMQDRLSAGYLNLAREVRGRFNTGAFVVPVGLAWQKVRYLQEAARAGLPTQGFSQGSELGSWALPYGAATFERLYSADHVHPSAAGTYLAACVVAAALTGCRTVGLQYHAASLGERWPGFLQTVADWTVHEGTPRDAPAYPWIPSTACGL